MKTINTSCGGSIQIIDDIFTFNERFQFKLFAQNSFYKLGRTSSEIWEHKHGTFFSCSFTEEDDRKFGLAHTTSAREKLSWLWEGRVINRSWINATLPGSRYYFHRDHPNKGHKTLLYYINLEWDKEDGGETLFANSNGEVEVAVSFVPGRIVIFDSELPHKPSLTADNIEPRFIYSCQLLTQDLL
jgi:hypothetical protein